LIENRRMKRNEKKEKEKMKKMKTLLYVASVFNWKSL